MRAVAHVDRDGARVANPLAVRVEAPLLQAASSEQAERERDREAEVGHGTAIEVDRSSAASRTLDADTAPPYYIVS